MAQKEAPLSSMVDAKISVITADGRNFVGILRGFDQATNLILDKCEERSFSTTGAETSQIGLYMIRGDTIAVVGEVDEDEEAQINLAEITAEPLKPITHGAH